MKIVEENYINVIFYLERESSGRVLTNAIAHKLQNNAATVSNMLKILKGKHLIDYVRYQGVRLTQKGERLATALIRRHRQWETFLVRKLNSGWDEVHDIAKQMEHIQSDKLTQYLDDYLGNPAVDPHGERIPAENETLGIFKKMKLSDRQTCKRCVIKNVLQRDSNLLRFLDKMRIKIGSQIQIINIEDFDNSLEIEIEGKPAFVSKEIAQNLPVEVYES